MNFEFEESWVLVGERRGSVWLARKVQYRRGKRDEVTFNARWVLRREEGKGDVIGFLHTHPPGHAQPSARDIRTMKAWAGSFGKSMLCVIVSDDVAKAFRFDDDQSNEKALATVQLFGKTTVVGVDDDAR